MRLAVWSGGYEKLILFIWPEGQRSRSPKACVGGNMRNYIVGLGVCEVKKVGQSYVIVNAPFALIVLLIHPITYSPFVTFMSSISMYADRERMTGTTVTKMLLMKNQNLAQQARACEKALTITRYYPAPTSLVPSLTNRLWCRVGSLGTSQQEVCF